MTKTELRNYIDSLFKKRRFDMEKAFNEKLESHVLPIINTLFTESESVEKKAAQLVKDYEKVLEKYKLETDWNATSVIRSINSNLIRWGDRKRSDLLGNVKVCVMNPDRETKWLEKFSEELREVVSKLQKSMRKDIDEIDALNQLKREVDIVIDKSVNAKKAYEQLVKLGINLDELELNKTTTLPAIQKFSVDVCVLNGGCK